MSKQSNSISQPASDDDSKSKAATNGARKHRAARNHRGKETKDAEEAEADRPETANRRKGRADRRKAEGEFQSQRVISSVYSVLTFKLKYQIPTTRLSLPSSQLPMIQNLPNLVQTPQLPCKNQLLRVPRHANRAARLLAVVARLDGTNTPGTGILMEIWTRIT